jgi:hypothetical protein
MQTTSPNKKMTHPFERFLAVGGTVICLVITFILWVSIHAHQRMWPLPGGYFVEMAVLSVVSAQAFLGGKTSGKFITWGAVGILTAFSIVGAFSVGFFYLPVALIFGGIAITSDVRDKQPVAAHFGVFMIAGIVQAVLMFVAIRLIYP